jgi:DNA polymerase III subunit delta'
MHPDEAYACLVRSARADRMAQAYLLLGPPQEQGIPLAVRIEQALFCETRDGCGTCAACRRVAERVHPDAMWVEPQKRSRIISIDQIRGVCARMNQTAFAGGWKACVILGADRLGDAAANAFLKTLEEPPGRSVFFLLTDSVQGLLPTIRSRCQHVLLSETQARLQGEFRTALTGILTRFGTGGGVNGMVLAEKLAGLLKHMKAAAAAEVKEEKNEDELETGSETWDARVNARYREWRMLLMRAVLQWQRDLLLLTGGGGGDVLEFPECADALRAQAGTLTYRAALGRVRDAADMYRRMEQNLPEQAVLHAGLIGWSRFAGREA